MWYLLVIYPTKHLQRGWWLMWLFMAPRAQIMKRGHTAFLTQLLRKPVEWFLLHPVSQSSQKAHPGSWGEDPATISRGKSCRDLEWACGVKNAVVTIFGKYNLPLDIPQMLRGKAVLSWYLSYNQEKKEHYYFLRQNINRTRLQFKLRSFGRIWIMNRDFY